MANSQNPIAQILAPLRLDFSNVRPESGTPSLHITKYQTQSITRIVFRKGPQAPQIPPRNRMTPRPRLQRAAPSASPGVPPVTRIFGAEGHDPTLSSSSFAHIVRHPGSAPKDEETTDIHPVISRLTRCGAGRAWRGVRAGDQYSHFPKPRPSGCDL
ncbi:hypothetical protein CKAH01_15183 [Colletotrichum kahawae]|uniref:Uncharacterized protein n=1 Tax=Colletotrichum kahawae TaxID=34407 RepID=A0AAD9YKG7_COLKA|nr:hypothetical protein CKAH01_15183 [Colletotrichum kahawae]